MSDFPEMFCSLLDDEKTEKDPMRGAQLLGTTDEEIPPLLNRKPPAYIRQQELAWHRVALEYAAKGFTAREIAQMVGCTPVSVQEILRQPQYQQTQVLLINKEVNRDKEVVEHIKDNVLMAVQTLSAIASDNKAKPADRITAARELLNRRYGMPNQPINRNTDVDLNKLSDAELAQMLVGATPTITATSS